MNKNMKPPNKEKLGANIALKIIWSFLTEIIITEIISVYTGGLVFLFLAEVSLRGRLHEERIFL